MVATKHRFNSEYWSAQARSPTPDNMKTKTDVLDVRKRKATVEASKAAAGEPKVSNGCMILREATIGRQAFY